MIYYYYCAGMTFFWNIDDSDYTMLVVFFVFKYEEQ